MADPSTAPAPPAPPAAPGGSGLPAPGEAAAADSGPPMATTPLTVVPRGPTRVRRRWLALLIGLVAIAALLAVEVPQFLSKPSQTTIWQKITSGIADSIVPKETALEAFAYVYKADIPDVVVPSGVDGDDVPRSGSGAMRWVQADWNQLSAAQQAVIDRYLPPESTRGTRQMTPAPSAAGLAPGFAPGLAPANGGLVVGRSLVDPSTVSRLQPRLAFDQSNGFPFVTNVAPDASPDLALAMADDMASIIIHLGPKLGIPVIYPGPVETPDIILTLSDTDGGNALLDTRPTAWSNGHYTPCNVTAYKNAWGNAAWTANDKVSPVLHVMLTHEVIHCYQNAVAGSIYVATAMPSWIIEGTADYLAGDDTGIVGPGDAGAWSDYLIAEVSLTTRSYDAVGYYALLAYKGRDLWGKMATAWKAAAAANSLQRSDAFISVLHGDDSDIRDAWAESYVNNSAWQDPWVLHGFGAPVDTSAPQREIQALAAPGWNGTLLSRSNTLLSVNATSGEVVTIATNGLASVHDFGGHAAVDFQEESFCTVQSCVCPPGTALAGQDVAPRQLSIPATVAVNAPEGGSKYAVIGSTLDDLCKRHATPAPQQPNYGPCGQNCTQSNGDPHMLTVNKYRYDFQAAGEFTLLRSADGSLDIQARQEPYGSGYVSINTAIAAKVDSHRVGVYMTATGLEARVDGGAVDLSSGPKDLGSGGRITAISKGFQIDFPDGTRMWALSAGQYGINAQIKPSDALRTGGVGVLGAVVPGGLAVPALPGGKRLPAATSDAQRKDIINGQFADAWRLTDATTLFDYDPGKTTASYTIKPYPTNPKFGSTTDLSPDQLAAGGSACSTITDPGLHDNCVFDIGVTGQAGFATNYATLQTFYDNGIASPTPTPAFSSVTPRPFATTGNFATVTQGTLGGYAIGTNDIVYMSVQTGDNKFSLIAFDPKAGKIVQQVDEPAQTPVHFAAGSVWLPGLKTDANGHNCSVTRVDAATLAEQATIATACSAFGNAPAMASDGDALWFVDISKLDIGTNLGTVLTRIDPTTDAPGAIVPMPSPGLSFADSQGALFLFDTGRNYWRLTTGSTALESIGKLQNYARPGGTGLWVGSQDGNTAQYFAGAGSPPTTVSVGGGVVAGDDHAVYVEVPAVNPTSGNFETQLWRYPLDGSTPTEIATAPILAGGPLAYFGDQMPNSNGDGLLKIWTTRVGPQQLLTILLQWTPIH